MGLKATIVVGGVGNVTGGGQEMTFLHGCKAATADAEAVFG